MAKERVTIKRVGFHEGHFFNIRSLSEDFHCQFGKIPKSELSKSIATTNTGVRMKLFDPNFLDSISDIKRGPQIPLSKDFGIIVAKTGIGKESVVVDSGSGSGYLSCMYANIAKKVYSFDVNEEHLAIAKNNAEFLGLKNASFKKLDIYSEKPELDEEADLVSLDLPEPWRALDNVVPLLKSGGFLTGYLPCITQVMEFVEAVNSREDLVCLDVLEVTQRIWIVDKKRVRPENQQLSHSGFIVFIRRV